MMGLDNPLHLAFLLMVVLLVFGAKRLPELGRSLGAGMRGFKESISGEAPTSAPALEQAPLHKAVEAAPIRQAD
jgi:sec-independent protein translocase protein TatA